MMKNKFFWFAILAILLLGCRNDYFNPNDQGDNQQAQKFRVVPKSAIPQIINDLQAKTNNFKVPLKNQSSVQGKVETAFGEINTDYIIETTNGTDEIFYTFPITPYAENASAETYNLVVVTDAAETETVRVIVYEPTAEWLVSGNNDFQMFSGNVYTYSLDGNLESEVFYLSGVCNPNPCPDCPTGPQGPAPGPGGGTTGGGGTPPTGPGHWNPGGGYGGGTSGGGTGGGTTPPPSSPPPSTACWKCISKDPETGVCNQQILVTCEASFTANRAPANTCTDQDDSGIVIYDPTKTPCEKTKVLMANTSMQTSITEIKNNATNGTGEMGFKATKSGAPSPMIPGLAHSVDFGDKTGYAGGYHNHTQTGIPMDSPADINQLLGFARAQGNNGDPTQAFVGMVAPNGMHYVIRFAGTYQDAISFNFMQDNIDKFTKDMSLRNNIFKSSSSTQGIEKLFFKTLNDMGLDGKIILQRVENDSTIKTINKNNDGTITAVPCS